LDCSTLFGNLACNGGNNVYSLKYIFANGIATFQSYPYIAINQTCQPFNPVFFVTSLVQVAQGNCNALQAAINI